MVACLQRNGEEIAEWVHGKSVIPERQEEVREKVGIIARMKENREDWRVVLIQLKNMSMHLRTHYLKQETDLS